MKTLLLAGAAALTMGLAAPERADAGGFAISFGSPRGGFAYSNAPFYGPTYGRGLSPVGYGRPAFGYPSYGHPAYGFNRGFDRRDFDRRDFRGGRDSGFLDRGDRRRLERSVRRVIRRW